MLHLVPKYLKIVFKEITIQSVFQVLKDQKNLKS